MIAQREIELKLAIAPSDAKRLQQAGPLSRKPSSRELQESIYFDTPEHELRKAGLTLRVRRCGDSIIQTIKSRSAGVGLFERDEWEMPVRAMKPELHGVQEDGLGRHLLESSENKLDPIARFRVDRTNWTIKGPSDLINISLDEGAVRAGGATASLTGIELELKHGPQKAVFDLCEKLAKHASLRIDVLTKPELAEALAEGRLSKPAKAERIEVRRDMTVAEGLTLIAFSCLRHFRLNEDLMLGRPFPEALHQLHVATRRLHTALLLFRPIVRGKKYRSLVRKLRWFGGRLGHARDLDLVIDLVGPDAEAVERLERSRKDAYDQIATLLASSRPPKLMLAIVRWLFIGKWRRRSAANAPLASFMTWRLDRSWARISEEGTRLSNMGDKERHGFRMRIKQFRYDLEFSRGVYGPMKGQRRLFRSALQEVQDGLGLLNDRRIARRLANGTCRVQADLADPKIELEVLSRATSKFRELLALGPYWRETATTRPAKVAARRRAAKGRPAASRMREPRSGGSARG